MRGLSIAAVGAIIGLLAGCLLKPGDQVVTEVPAVAKTFANAESLRPDVAPYTSARLLLAGTPLTVSMARSQKNDIVSFDLIARKEVLEVERYQLDENGFRFASLSDEKFVPPIPLVRYPFTVGESWHWSGTAGLGPNEKKATAELTSASETVNLAGGVHGCVVIVANLVVASPGGTDSKRTLRFWIEPKKGIIKREFGFSSTREPRPPGSP